MSARKITVYNTGGKQGKVIETSSLNWADLQKDLSANGVSYSGMKAVIGKTKTNLEHKDAVLPGEDFTLFLFPEKTRSGAGKTAAQIEGMSFGEVRAEIKAIFEKDGDKAKDHFNKDKNYTNKSTAEIKQLLVTYSGAKGAAKAPAKTEVAKATTSAKALPAGKASSTKPARVERKAVPEAKPEVTSASELKTDEQKIDFMVNLIEGLDAPSEFAKAEAVEAICQLRATGEVKGKKTVGSIDTVSLDAEAAEIRKGLSGVK